MGTRLVISREAIVSHASVAACLMDRSFHSRRYNARRQKAQGQQRPRALHRGRVLGSLCGSLLCHSRSGPVPRDSQHQSALLFVGKGSNPHGGGVPRREEGIISVQHIQTSLPEFSSLVFCFPKLNHPPGYGNDCRNPIHSSGIRREHGFQRGVLGKRRRRGYLPVLPRAHKTQRTLRDTPQPISSNFQQR